MVTSQIFMSKMIPCDLIGLSEIQQRTAFNCTSNPLHLQVNTWHFAKRQG